MKIEQYPQPMGQERNIKRKIRKHFEMNENKDTIYQNIQDAAKTMLRGKYIALNTYIKKKKYLKSIT